jgi:hypothetical protein
MTHIEPSLFDILNSVVPLSTLFPHMSTTYNPSIINNNELPTILYRGISHVVSKFLSIQLPIRTVFSNGVYSIDLTQNSPHYHDFSFKDVYLVQKQYYLIDTIYSLAMSSGVLELIFESDIEGNAYWQSFLGCDNEFFHSYSDYNYNNADSTTTSSSSSSSNANSFEVLNTVGLGKSIPGFHSMLSQLQTDRSATWCISKKPVCTSKHSDRLCQIKVDSLASSCIWIQEGIIPLSNMSQIVSYNLSMPVFSNDIGMMSIGYIERERYQKYNFSTLLSQVRSHNFWSYSTLIDLSIVATTIIWHTVWLVIHSTSTQLICLVLGSVMYLYADTISSWKAVQFFAVLFLGPLLLGIAILTEMYRYV